MIVFEEYIDLLRQLIAVPSFSREERSACDVMEAWLRAHHVDAHGAQYPLRRDGNNLILEQEGRGDGRPVLLLNAHIDTVRPVASYTRDPFEASLESDVLYGLGSNDDGGSLVALLAVYLQLVQTQQPYRLVYAATAEEEVCGREGIERILPSLGPIALGIIGEPTRMQMAVAERGLMVLDCVAHGKSGHAARGEGVNAIYEALPAIEWFRSYVFPKVSPWLGPVGMNVTMVQAGTQHNVVPDACSFVVDVRPNGMYANEELLSLIQAALPDIEIKARSTRLGSSHIARSSHCSFASISTHACSGGDPALLGGRGLQAEAGETAMAAPGVSEHPVVQRGLELGLEAFGSPTCSNQTLCPFPTLKIGPGDSARSHTADEFILLSEIREGIDIFVRLLDQLEI
jgi:acetylornithine deacetylase